MSNALIAMAVHDVKGSGRSWMTNQTLSGIFESNILEGNQYKMIVVDNGSCDDTKDILKNYREWFPEDDDESPFCVITLAENVGTARAINKAWAKRKGWEYAVKMDNDVEIYDVEWLDKCIEAIERDPTIGICALKRKDCIETPWNENPWYRSTLRMLPHDLGQSWIIVEEVNHAMGTCQVYSPALLDKIGYLYQMGGLYGFDDALACVRAHVAGFKTVFLPHIEIEHVDPGGTDYTKWKQDYGWKKMKEYNIIVEEYRSGKRAVYHGPDDE